MTAFPEERQAGRWYGFAAELAEAPQLVVRLIEEHRPNAAGRCVSSRCREAGLPLRWPCAVYAVAGEAHRLIDRRVVGSPSRHLVAVDDRPGRAEPVARARADDPLEAEIREFFAAQVPGA